MTARLVSALAGVALLATACTLSASPRPPTAAPTEAQARTLLATAARFAQAHNYAGLCQSVAEDDQMCRTGLQVADESHAAPSNTEPTVLGASTDPGRSANSQPAEVLHIRGNRADGTTYESDFSAVFDEPNQVRSSNPVYWFSSFGG